MVDILSDEWWEEFEKEISDEQDDEREVGEED